MYHVKLHALVRTEVDYGDNIIITAGNRNDRDAYSRAPKQVVAEMGVSEIWVASRPE